MESKVNMPGLPIEHTGKKKSEVKPVAQEGRVLTSEMQRCAERIWNSLSKLMTVDQDGIFKDPNWPHLWDHKK